MISFHGNYKRSPMLVLDAVASETATAFSEILDCRGMSTGWVALLTSGFDVDTDLIGTIEIYGGVTADTALMRQLPIDGTETVPLSASWPTGLTLVSNAITFADTFASNEEFNIPLINLPPYIAIRRVRTSGGSATAYITVKVAAV